MKPNNFGVLSEPMKVGIVVTVVLFLGILFFTLIWRVTATQEELDAQTECYTNYRNIDRAIEMCVSEGKATLGECLSMWGLKIELMQKGECAA